MSSIPSTVYIHRLLWWIIRAFYTHIYAFLCRLCLALDMVGRSWCTCFFWPSNEKRHETSTTKPLVITNLSRNCCWSGRSATFHVAYLSSEDGEFDGVEVCMLSTGFRHFTSELFSFVLYPTAVSLEALEISSQRALCTRSCDGFTISEVDNLGRKGVVIGFNCSTHLSQLLGCNASFETASSFKEEATASLKWSGTWNGPLFPGSFGEDTWDRLPFLTRSMVVQVK